VLKLILFFKVLKTVQDSKQEGNIIFGKSFQGKRQDIKLS
jgi:hypothetical protein